MCLLFSLNPLNKWEKVVKQGTQWPICNTSWHWPSRNRSHGQGHISEKSPASLPRHFQALPETVTDSPALQLPAGPHTLVSLFAVTESNPTGLISKGVYSLLAGRKFPNMCCFLKVKCFFSPLEFLALNLVFYWNHAIEQRDTLKTGEDRLAQEQVLNP